MKNERKIKIIKKTEVLAFLVILMAVLNILALVFTVVKGEIRFLSGDELFYANGFTLAFSGYPAIVEGCGNILRVCAVAYLALSLALIASVAVFCSVKRSFDFGKFGVFAIISSLVLSVCYMVLGIVAYSAASDYAGLYYECSTAAFIPFIISAILALAFFLVKYKCPDEIELS